VPQRVSTMTTGRKCYRTVAIALSHCRHRTVECRHRTVALSHCRTLYFNVNPRWP
jgi:hypothetical protein